MLQNYARKYRVAVDRLSFAYTVLRDTDGSSVGKAPEDGCLVHGIFLEGCRWDADRGTLVSNMSSGFAVFSLISVIAYSKRSGFALRQHLTSLLLRSNSWPAPSLMYSFLFAGPFTVEGAV